MKHIMFGASTSEIRQSFLNYFRQKNHHIVPSSSLIPHQDHTLLFTNSGMVPFKNIFIGIEKYDHTQVASVQKCIRAGGKHNDLENVGYTTKHHTFFEMLGNFSFGEYFKEKAIFYAWDLITKEYGISKDYLIITVHHKDKEAKNLWKKISGLSDNRIISITTLDNFWSMGDTGPCGPCSEIFYDHGENFYKNHTEISIKNTDRYVEIWNLVFMQYNTLCQKKQIDLPKHSVDTGMGLERIVAILQGVHSNYDIDLFRNLIHSCAEIMSCKITDDTKISFQIIADHLRSCSFLITDNVIPSNEGRGYVLRRIMRRAMSHIYKLGTKDPIMWKMVPALIKQMGKTYSELSKSQTLIQKTFQLEEEKFLSTLEQGIKLLNKEILKISGTSLRGNIAFQLYDTYGFPLDLTKDILRSKNLHVNEIEFNYCMKTQKIKARSNWSNNKNKYEDSFWISIYQHYGKTKFLGYSQLEAKAVIQSIIIDNKEIKELRVQTIKQKVSIIVNQTPFYGESGGQSGDQGTLIFNDGQVSIKDTIKKIGNLIIHQGTIEKGILKPGQEVFLSVNVKRRQSLQLNHSATHLLHQTLISTLGSQVVQKGSLIEENHLYFDFNHIKALTIDELQYIEQKINSLIQQNLPVQIYSETLEQAIKQKALMLSTKKYTKMVRVVSINNIIKEKVIPYSIELCGGTHVKNTGDIGILKIISEQSISSGIRRIKAITGNTALKYLQNQDSILRNLTKLLQVSIHQLEEKVKVLVKTKKNLEKELKKTHQYNTFSTNKNSQKRVIGKIQFFSQHLKNVPTKKLYGIIDQIKKEINSGVIAISNTKNGRVSIIVAVTKDLSPSVNAIDLVQKASKILDGQGGGGRIDMAQGGGKNTLKITEAIEYIAQVLSKK